MKFATSLLLLAISGLFPLLAGEAPDFKKSIIEPPADVEKQIDRTVILAQTTYVGESGFRRGAGKFGEQDSLGNFFVATHRVPLGGRWYFKLGALYQRFDFGSSTAPVPSHLQAAAAVIALEYVVNGEVGFFIEAFPGAYFSDDLDTNAINIPTNIAFAYPVVDDTFYLIGGIAYSGFREYQVLPLFGVLWKINPEWTLKAYLPHPRLIYQPNERLQIWAGGELAGGSYRTNEHHVSPAKLSGALVTYSEYRAGAGITYAIAPGFTVDAAAGYVFSREFDFHRAGEVYGLEGAPYVQLGGTLQF